ncbi:MAG: hypothetical protein H7A24_08745 [Leptospiraceae bacterium]|nr:hypothetical protein [Leptospiraceae bacterium]MCP5511955.1 hypothetical protein [Leptospiraceae bacterium]
MKPNFLYSYYRLIFFFPIIFLSFFLQSLSADEDETIRSIQKLSDFSKQGDRFSVIEIESFDGSRSWEFHKSTSYLQNHSFSENLPDSNPFQKETEVFKEVLSKENPRSLFIQTYLEIPDREKIWIRPTEPIVLGRGIPVRASVWLRSESYRGNIFLVWKSSDGKLVRVNGGDLNFWGWKRLDISLPFREKSGLNTYRKKRYEFLGIQMQFSKLQKKSTFLFYLDRILVLLDKKPRDYPGVEIDDGWTLQ